MSRSLHPCLPMPTWEGEINSYWVTHTLIELDHMVQCQLLSLLLHRVCHMKLKKGCMERLWNSVSNTGIVTPSVILVEGCFVWCFKVIIYQYIAALIMLMRSSETSHTVMSAACCLWLHLHEICLFTVKNSHTPTIKNTLAIFFIVFVWLYIQSVCA